VIRVKLDCLVLQDLLEAPVLQVLPDFQVKLELLDLKDRREQLVRKDQVEVRDNLERLVNILYYSITFQMIRRFELNI
jgi:hypothetical protein